MEKKLISIIIRTKNEERWIGLCIERIKKQDNNSVIAHKRLIGELYE